MTLPGIFIESMGIISPLGSGLAATKQALWQNKSALAPLELFPLKENNPLPVGEVRDKLVLDDSLPRTHQLALAAADEAMAGCDLPFDAVIIGTTTGGILTTETLLSHGEKRQEYYQNHGLDTVCLKIAEKYNCDGGAFTISTACSSSAVAIKIAIEMLRRGDAKRILVGGVDSLCRLTYFGFNSLQLIDPNGSRPLDKNRHGMSVAEGAAMLLLTAEKTPHSIAEVLGAGLSCDAYHPAAPHPEGDGAFRAMQKALVDSGVDKADIGYINMHGTGTPDNDLAEARAINNLFANDPPNLSSIKGATGHSLGAAGAIEAVISALVVSRQIMPGNTRCLEVDPKLQLNPIVKPLKKQITAVLSNSLGFGGNNASLIIGQSGAGSVSTISTNNKKGFKIIGSSCITGAGHKEESMAALWQGQTMAGLLSLNEISSNLPPREVRRLKRLSRIVLSLADDALPESAQDELPDAVFMGTGWGALSETYDFLNRLTETDEKFPSPTDFVGSVHNGAASQVAIKYNSKGANITTSGGDYSFEQALMTAEFIADDENSIFVIGADEGHPIFSPLFDKSIAYDLRRTAAYDLRRTAAYNLRRTAKNPLLADGGGGFCLTRGGNDDLPQIRVPFFKGSEHADVIDELIASLGGADILNEKIGLVLVGIPAAFHSLGQAQLAGFIEQSGFQNPVINYRKFTGEFASASAIAAVMAVDFLENGEVPMGLCAGTAARADKIMLNKKGALVLGLGKFITAMEILP